MARIPPSKARRLTLAQQHVQIHRRFPGFRMRKGRNPAEKTWIGTLQPTPDSPIYTVEVAYRERGVPKVWVVSPQIRAYAPHIYRPEGCLCLYTPSEWGWYGDRIIAETIIPWTASWLCYYELWVDTGQWYGPETPHGAAKTRDT